MILKIVLYSLAIVVLLAFSAFFSGSEIAFSSVKKARLETSRSGGAKQALYIYEHFDRGLSTILIGNNLVNISASSVATLLALLIVGTHATAATQDIASTVASILLTVLVLIFGETMPKIVAKRNTLRFTLAASRPLRFLMVILTPVTWVIDGLARLLTAPLKGETLNEEEVAEAAEEELIDLIETSEGEGIIDVGQSELLQNVLDFSEISVQEVMTPRVNMYALEIDDEPEEIRQQIEESPYSRLPVYDERRERIIGVLHLNHYYRALLDSREVDLKGLLMEPCFVYKTMKLPAVLSMLQQRKTHLAIVIDDYGSTIGMATMEDVLEEIVGDIWDETDEVVDEVIERSDNEYEVDGDLSISEMCELLDWDEDDFETDSVTVGGWILERLGGFPQPGDTMTYEDVTVTVLSMDDLRVGRALITAHPAPADPEEPEKAEKTSRSRKQQPAGSAEHRS